MTYDPYSHAERRHANRRTVPAPPDPHDQVPGHEGEALAWMVADGLDPAEVAERVALVAAVEAKREGGPRESVLAGVEEAREMLAPTPAADDSQADAAGRDDDKGPRRRLPENDGRAASDEVAKPETAQATAAGTYTADDVPGNAVDAARFVRNGTDAADQAARARVAWDVEEARDDGVRGTVRHEVAKHLDDVDPAGS